MKKELTRASCALLVIALLPTPQATADEGQAGDGNFSGRFLVGYRNVDIDGSITKYREDLNLDDGPRLFELNFDYEAPEESRHLDRLQLDVTSFGGDPFETLRFSARKHGRYDLKYHRVKSDYFYADTILPVALSQPSLSNAGDFHTFDFERVRDTASFGFRFNQRAKLDVGFERFTKRGEATTTLDVQRDEFELDQVIDESYNQFHVALELTWPRATLILQEEVRDFDNAVEIFLPGLSLGEDPEDATILDFFFLEQPYSLESIQHTVRLNAHPNDRFLIRAAASLQNLDLDAEASERSQGIDFAGRPFTTDLAGGGDIERDSDLIDVDVSYLIGDRVALIGGVRRHHFDQTGAYLFGGDPASGSWDVETTGAEAGIEFHVTPRLSLGGGARLENREAMHATLGGGLDSSDTEETEHTGFFANLAWRPSKAFRLDLEVEDSSYDDPFTLSSPTDRQRWRLRGRYRWSNGCYFQGTYLAYRFENDPSGWQSDRDQLEARGGWRRDGLDLGVGYSRIESDREIDQSVITAPGFGGGVRFLYPILYTSEADYLDGRLRWQLDPRWTVGGDLRFYENDGSFAHQRRDLRAYVELALDIGYLVRIGYRDIDYDEDAFDFDDHDARITELAVGYAW